MPARITNAMKSKKCIKSRSLLFFIEWGNFFLKILLNITTKVGRKIRFFLIVRVTLVTHENVY
jgi:hypothetical protein